MFFDELLENVLGLGVVQTVEGILALS